MRPPSRSELPSSTVLLLALAAGLLIASLYYEQPIAGLMIRDLHLPLKWAGLLATLPLAGYGLGLLLAVPLGDMVENRKLILAMTAIEAVLLVLLALAPNAVLFLGVGLFTGLSASAIQVILPYASRFFTGEAQGRAVARIVSGVMLGILVARPAASFTAQVTSWRTIYFIAAGLLAATVVLLAVRLPPRPPAARQSYGKLLASMPGLFRGSELLRRRAFYQSAMFGAFISFWTAAPLWLSRPPFNLSQGGIAWVALAGVAGALAPQFVTRLVDKGLGRLTTRVGMVLAAAAFAVSLAAPRLGLTAVVTAAVMLDVAASGNLVIGQRAVYAMAPELRSRVTALFIATFFAAGAAASVISAWCFVEFGWKGVAELGAALPILALAYALTEPRGDPQGAG